MQKILFLVLIVILFFSFPINAQTNKYPVEIIENFENDGEQTLAKLFTYEIKESIRDSNIMKLNNGTGKRMALLITTLPYNDYSNNAFIFSVNWVMIDSNSDELPIFVNSTLGYCGKDIYEEYTKNIFVQTEDLFRDIM